MDIGWHFQNLLARAGLALLKASGAYDSYFGHWRGELFNRAEAKGLHVMPAHYYAPTPTVARLKSDLWAKRESLYGLDLKIDEALALLQTFAETYAAEYNNFPRQKLDDPRRFTLANPAYGAGDAELYYAMIRHLKPRRVIEIGCGYSTLAASLAIAKNREEAPDRPCHYVCIEPYLPEYLRPAPDGVSEVIELGVEKTPLSRFEELSDGDILFIDSTHVAAIGSDVVYEYLDILPRLQKGVVVHIHDIFLPLEYPEKWTREQRYFWNEQYLLQAFLLHNDAWEVMMPAHALYALHHDEMAKAIPALAMTAHGPANFWMRKTR
ncbi:MAG: class I SAM-dependent methyltransferase [Parvularculaceae bacterium]